MNKTSNKKTLRANSISKICVSSLQNCCSCLRSYGSFFIQFECFELVCWTNAVLCWQNKNNKSHRWLISNWISIMVFIVKLFILVAFNLKSIINLRICTKKIIITLSKRKQTVWIRIRRKKRVRKGRFPNRVSIVLNSSLILTVRL